MNKQGEQFVERLGRFAEAEGLPRIAGRMMGLLILAGDPLSINDVARKLKVSRASVSTNGRLLQSLEIAQRVTKPGNRRDYIQISHDPCSSMLSVGVRRLHQMREAVSEMRVAVPPGGDRNTIRRRIERMEQFYDLAITRAESVLAAWRRERARGS